MSHKIICDGCGVFLYAREDLRPNEGRELAIQGRRINSLGGGGLPQGQFHWCFECAKIAFKAVRDG